MSILRGAFCLPKIKGVNNLEKWATSAIGSIGFLVSYLIDGLSLAVVILIAVMFIDYVTGLMQAWHNKELSSRIGMAGFIRKLYVLLLVGSVYLVEGLLFETGHAGSGVAIAYIAIEFISITENGVRMGAPMPPYVTNLLDIMNNKKDGDK